jgi:hypothetical protein
MVVHVFCEHYNNRRNKSTNNRLWRKKVSPNHRNGKKRHCHYCNSTEHLCRDCPEEKKNAPTYKLVIGKWAEKYVAKYPCPGCRKKTLEFLGDHTPSLDVRCTNKTCNHIIEVKSKCLSVKNLPNDIFMHHGNFNFYQQRVQQGLTFVFVIYSVDRRTKTFNVRKVFYVDNDKIKKGKVVQVRRVEYCNSSRIFIPNTKNIDSWKIIQK